MNLKSDPVASEKSLFRGWLTPVKILLLVLVFSLSAWIGIYFWRKIFISIDSGKTGVLYRLFSGTETREVYDPGLHIIAPWNDIFIYETRKQLASQSFNVLSVRGLPVQLELAIRYHPDREQVGILHKTIGPDYLERVVLPQVQSVIRKHLSSYTAEQIYTNYDNLLNKAVVQAQEEVGRNYVVAEEIIIRSISLPLTIKQAIEAKIIQRELLESYAFRLQTAAEEAERLRNEARGIRDYQKQIDPALNEDMLEYNGILATQELALSNNAKVIILGGGKDGLPLVSGNKE